MRMSCDIEIRDMPERQPWSHRRAGAGPGSCPGLQPDGRRLAYAGGPAQAIQSWIRPRRNQPAREIRGAGSTPFDVRFSQDGKVIGFTRDGRPGQSSRVVRGVRPGAASGANHGAERRSPRRDPASTRDGPSSGVPIRSELVAVDANGASGPNFRDRPLLERQAWSSTFIPGAPAHPARHGRHRHRVRRRRLRLRDRHDAPASTPATARRSSRWPPRPTADGWPAARIDQTVMLYPLDGCDTRPPLGATFRPRPTAPGWSTSSNRRSFAAAMGLLPGDVIVEVGIAGGTDGKKYYRTAAEIDEFFGLLPSLEPYLYEIGIKVRRTVLVPTHRAHRVRADDCRRPGATTRRWPSSWGRTVSGCSGRPRATMTRRSKGTRGSSAGTSTRRSRRPGRPTSCRSARSPSDEPPRHPRSSSAHGRAGPGRGCRPAAAVWHRRSAAAGRGGGRGSAAADRLRPDPGRHPAPGSRRALGRGPAECPGRARISAGGKSAIRGGGSSSTSGRSQPERRTSGRSPSSTSRCRSTDWSRTAACAWPSRPPTSRAAQRTETIDLVYRLPPPAAPAPDKAAAQPPVPPPRPPRLHLLAIGCDQFGAGLPPVDVCRPRRRGLWPTGSPIT